MSIVIRAAGVAWCALFTLIFLVLLAMPYFVPLSWPARAPVFVRLILLLAYWAANLAVGLYTAFAASTKPRRAAITQGTAILALAGILWWVETGITATHDNATWRVLVALADGSAALTLSLIGPCLIVLGLLAPYLGHRKTISPGGTVSRSALSRFRW